MHFSLLNHLPYATIGHLLHLLHLLPESQLPRSLYRLKQQYCSNMPNKKLFCSACLKEIPLDTRECRNAVYNQYGGEVCWYINVSFEDHHLQVIYKGTLIATFQNNACAALLIIFVLIYSIFWEVLQYPFTRTSDPNFICAYSGWMLV